MQWFAPDNNVHSVGCRIRNLITLFICCLENISSILHLCLSSYPIKTNRKLWEETHQEKVFIPFPVTFFFFAQGRKDQASKSPKCCLVPVETHLSCAREIRECSPEQYELKCRRKSVKHDVRLHETQFWILSSGTKFWNVLL